MPARETTKAASTRSAPTLLTLPPEIRDTIFRHLFTGGIAFIRTDGADVSVQETNVPGLLAIFLFSKSTYRQARRAFWSHARVSVVEKPQVTLADGSTVYEYHYPLTPPGSGSDFDDGEAALVRSVTQQVGTKDSIPSTLTLEPVFTAVRRLQFDVFEMSWDDEEDDIEHHDAVVESADDGEIVRQVVASYWYASCVLDWDQQWHRDYKIYVLVYSWRVSARDGEVHIVYPVLVNLDDGTVTRDLGLLPDQVLLPTSCHLLDGAARSTPG